MLSFYGGQPGQSFKLDAIFPNRVSLQTDLTYLHHSGIGVNSYVLINYGLQNSVNKEYQDNKEIDKEAYENKSYNMTLWQKVYAADIVQKENSVSTYYYNDQEYFISDIEFHYPENATTPEGYCYINLGCWIGTTPEFQLEENVEVLAPGDNPSVTLNTSNIEYPVLGFKLPRAPKFFIGNWVSIENLPESMLNGDYIIDQSNGQIYLYKNNSLIEQGKIIPQFSVDLEVLEAENNPTVKLNYVGDNILNPQFVFGLPKGKSLEILPTATLADPYSIEGLTNIIISYLNSQVGKIKSYQVKPLTIQVYEGEDASITTPYSYWCTCNNNTWYLQPVSGGGTANLQWEDLDEEVTE